jgi:serine/threonine protein kinase
MELVDGDDLSRRIAKGAIPLDEALPMAKQIAEALEAAHERRQAVPDPVPGERRRRQQSHYRRFELGRWREEMTGMIRSWPAKK